MERGRDGDEPRVRVRVKKYLDFHRGLGLGLKNIWVLTLFFFMKSDYTSRSSPISFSKKNFFFSFFSFFFSSSRPFNKSKGLIEVRDSESCRDSQLFSLSSLSL